MSSSTPPLPGDERRQAMLPDLSEVTPVVAHLMDPGGGSRSPRPGGRLRNLVDEERRRLPPRLAVTELPPPRVALQTVTAGDLDRDLAETPGATAVVMDDLDNVLSSFREVLLADVSRVVAASPAWSTQGTPRDPSIDTRKSNSGSRLNPV